MCGWRVGAACLWLKLVNGQLKSSHPAAPLQNITLGQAVAGMSSGRVPPLAAMYAWLLSKVGRDLDAVPGGEFAAAAQAAQAVGAVVRARG